MQPLIERLLHWDADVSSWLAAPELDVGVCDIRLLFLLMEWSMHGILWLAVSFTGTFYSLGSAQQSPAVRWRWCVLMFGILLDLAVVGAVKIAVQRGRPAYNRDDQIYEAPVADKFSFPSGHSSRGSMLAVLAIVFAQSRSRQSGANTDSYYSAMGHALIVLFPLVLALSRVVMGRHYLSDVIAGLLLGLAEGVLALLLPMTLVEFVTVQFRQTFGHFG